MTSSDEDPQMSVCLTVLGGTGPPIEVRREETPPEMSSGVRQVPEERP